MNWKYVAQRFSLFSLRYQGGLFRHTLPHCWILFVNRTGLLRLMMKRISKGQLERYLLVTFISSSASCRNWSRIPTPPSGRGYSKNAQKIHVFDSLILPWKTIASIHTFLLAIVLHPQEFKKVQEEIDRVVGRHRLPTIDDRPSLPYLECLLKEVLRWVYDFQYFFSFLVSWIHE